MKSWKQIWLLFGQLMVKFGFLYSNIWSHWMKSSFKYSLFWTKRNWTENYVPEICDGLDFNPVIEDDGGIKMSPAGINRF